jgi:hypothetical protein
VRRAPRNLKIACDHAGLTHFGGVYFFHEFLQLLQFRDVLARHIVYPRRNCRYTVAQMMLALIYPIVLGLDRVETASFLRSNGTFQYLTGLPSFPDPQTLRRFLFHAPEHFCEQLHRTNDRLLQTFIHLLPQTPASQPIKSSFSRRIQVIQNLDNQTVAPLRSGK